MKKNNEVRTIYWYIDKFKELEKLEKETPNNFSLGGRFRSYITSIKEGKEFNWEEEFSINS